MATATIPDRWVRSLADQMRETNEMNITVHIDNVEIGYYPDDGLFRVDSVQKNQKLPQLFFSIDQIPRHQQIWMTLSMLSVLMSNADFTWGAGVWPEA